MTPANTTTIRAFFGQFWGLILLNIVLWALIPGFLFGNLHVDTLEALYWAKEPALGYWKHPPLTTWLLGLVHFPGPYSIFAILLLSQTLTIATAYFIWRIARGLGQESAAQLSVFLFFTSTLASYYAIQINHNSVLAPFMAATLCYGVEYLERRRNRAALGLGIAVALGVYAKYEILFAVIPLIVLAIIIPRYRSAFFHWKSYGAIALTTLLISPHLYWMHIHGWSSLQHAADSAPISTVLSVFEGFWGLLWGIVAIFLTPLLMLRLLKIEIPLLRLKKYFASDEPYRIGWIILVISPLSVIGAGLITGQFVKSLWLIPIAPAISVGLALTLEHTGHKEFFVSQTRLTAKAMVGLSGLFWIYLLAGEVISHPHEAYFSQTRPLAQQVEALWQRHQTKPLSCVIINEVKIGGSPTLWIKDKPLFIELPFGPWADEAKQNYCKETGAIIINLDEGVTAKNYFPRLCENTSEPIDVKSTLGQSTNKWPGHMIYLPPSNESCGN